MKHTESVGLIKTRWKLPNRDDTSVSDTGGNHVEPVKPLGSRVAVPELLLEIIGQKQQPT